MIVAAASLLAQQTNLPGGSPSTQQQQPSATSPSQTGNSNTTPNAQAGGNSSTEASAPGATANEIRDKLFLRKSAENSMAEIEIARLVLQKSSADDVKKFADRMVRDHTALMEKMKPFADQYGVRTPKDLSKDHKVEIEKLSALSGDEFDKQYIVAMVTDHHKDLKEFQMEERATDNTDLRSAVDDGRKIIARHTAHIDMIAMKHGIATPSN